MLVVEMENMPGKALTLYPQPTYLMLAKIY